MLSGKEQVARRESKAPSRRRPSVDLHVAVAQLSRVLQMVEAMTYRDCTSLQDPSAFALIRIPGNGHCLSGEKYIVITCPECLRDVAAGSWRIHMPYPRNGLRPLAQFD
jgi:hypothetical protein